MTTQVRKMTVSEFLELPETNLPHELINGEEIMSPSPSLAHQRLVIRLLDLVRKLIPDGEVFIAPLDVYLDNLNLVQLDLMWISATNTNALLEDKFVRGAPDLVVEVLSPGTERRDKKEKFQLYEKFGVREYWLIDPDEKLLEMYRHEEGRLMRVDVFGPQDACTSPMLGEVEVSVIFR